MVLGRRNRLLTRFAASALLVISILLGIHGSQKANAVYGGTSTASCSVSQSQIVTNGVTENVETFTATSNTTTGNCSFTVPDGVYALDYLVVGGGGGGGSGGGGGGQVVTSWTTRTTQNGADVSRLNPLFVNPGESLTVTVGAGGRGGYGGEVAWSNPALQPARSGDTSTIGSVNAVGGGFGGGGPISISAGGYTSACTAHPSLGYYTVGVNGYCGSGLGASGGSSGGNAFDNTGNPANSSASTVQGARSFGNLGGTGTGTADVAGGGGGGAGGAGANAGLDNAGTSRGGGFYGGNGGLGIWTNIVGGFTAYGCGGGGGVNRNNDTQTANGGGVAGCNTAGNGSGFGVSQFVSQSTSVPAGITCVIGSSSAIHSCFTGTVAASGFGGGGGGTDPDGYGAGDGGSGVVIVRYLVPSPNCPPASAPNTSSYPVACTQTIHVVAGRAASTIDLRNYPSYSDTATTTVDTVTSINNISISLSSNILSASVASATSALIGGTYPLIYKLTTSGVSTASEAYLLVNVIDPAQKSPSRVPVDPRASSIDLPPVVIGTVSAVLICVTPNSDTVTAGYGNLPTVTLRPGYSGTPSSDVPSTGAIRIRGTNAQISQYARYFRISKNSSDSRLIPRLIKSRYLNINVSNTATGGNGSCTGGTSSTIELYPVNLSRGNSFKVQVKK